MVLFLLSACRGEPPTPTVSLPSLMPKLLATVYLSPTPNAIELQATRAANPPTATLLPPTHIPTATSYIGVFLGEAEGSDGGPVIYPALVNNPPTPIETPTTQVTTTCPIQSDPVFGSTWSSNNPEVARQMGCAAQVVEPFRGVSQVFERGVMYWRGDTNEIWAIATTGVSSGHYWFVANAAEAPKDDLAAPEGLRVPVRGFGTVWRTTPGVREGLGYARLDEQPLSMSWQRFDGGLLLRDDVAGQVFVLLVNGASYGPY